MSLCSPTTLTKPPSWFGINGVPEIVISAVSIIRQHCVPWQHLPADIPPCSDPIIARQTRECLGLSQY
jgi:hypothetical protein